MSDSNESREPIKSNRPCPHCGEFLLYKGRVVDVDDSKKWVEEWRCPTHGVIDPDLHREKPM